MKLLDKIFRVGLPTADEVLEEENKKRKEVAAKIRSESDKHEPLGSLLFLLQQNGEIQIHCEWKEDTKKCGEFYGDFLHRICSGKLNNTIGHILTQAAMNSQNTKPFSIATMEMWEKLHVADDGKPMIHPMAVFKMTQQESNNES